MNKFIKKIYTSVSFFAAFFIICIVFSIGFSKDVATSSFANDNTFFAFSYNDVNILKNDLNVLVKNQNCNFILSCNDVIPDKINIMLIIEMDNEYDIRLALELLNINHLPANVVISEPYSKKLMSDFNAYHNLCWGCYFFSNAVSDLNQTLLDFAFETGKACSAMYSSVGYFYDIDEKLLSEFLIPFWQFGNGINFVNSLNRNRIVRLNNLSINDYFISLASNFQAACP